MNRPARPTCLPPQGEPAAPPPVAARPAGLDPTRHFPLVARARLACAGLDDRIAEIAELAAGDTTLIAVAHNKAALIASDCGHHDLAAELCHAHHDRYRTLPAWTAHDARLALEPLVNLARLHIRRGDPTAAVGHLQALWDLVDTAEEHLVDGRPVRLRGISRGSGDHRAVRTWLWTVVLAEGVRALTAAGRWADALAHAERHHGIGLRLLDGRQVAIVAHSFDDPDRAVALLDTSVFDEPWEQLVADRLRALLRPGCRPQLLLDRAPTVRLGPRYNLFAARLGLAVIDLLGSLAAPHRARATDLVRRLAGNTGTDAYVAREILRHPIADELGDDVRDTLTMSTTRAGLANAPAADEIATRLRSALAGQRQM